MIRILLLIFLCISTVSALAAQDSYAFESVERQTRFNNLTEVLRCPMCQNQNIADSDAMISHDMRRKVYQLLQDGKTDQEVIDYMKARYGDFVYYEPPVTAGTIWLWILPALFALIATVVVLKRRKPKPDTDMAAKLVRADEILQKDKSS
ncbi:cytochrome c-type biogenesis protein [Salinimonas chungwhensis]|uniref:cytochrome c-type biogenesis protein n=1 Tax=Salinimonas chungwhensis TaxID=265425 RepID=UPI0003719C04|nr:cytochrome c-type biogenesis protein [Salinimonas chungwhensis]